MKKIKYYEIHIVLDDETRNGYSIFVSDFNKKNAVEKAKEENLFSSEYDYEDIDYIREIDKEEYERATI